MDLRRVHHEQDLLADDPYLLDALAERLRDRPEPVDDFLRGLAHAIVFAAGEYDRILADLSGTSTFDANQPTHPGHIEGLSDERREEIREMGSTLGVDLTIRLRALHRAQEDPESAHYLTELTPAEKLLGRLSQGLILLVGLGYRAEVPDLLMTRHELRQRLGEPEVAQWLINHTDSNPWEAPVDPSHEVVDAEIVDDVPDNR